jgi:hypothetical protein
MFAEALLGGVKQGISIFEDVQQGKFATEQTALTSKFEEEGAALKVEGGKLKDIAPFFEEGKEDDPALMAFKDRQKAFLEASKQFPNKHKEMRQRSGALLKEYIAKYPGLADEFRTSSANITGIGRLDLENLRELYTDVEWLQKKEADDAAANSKALEQLRDAFVKQQVATGKMDEVNARVLASSITTKQMQELAASTQEQTNAQAAAAESLKVGGSQLQSYVNHKRTEWVANYHSILGAAHLQLNKMGVTRAGAMTPEKLQSPEVRKVLDEAVSTYSSALDKFYAEASARLNASLGRGDPTVGRQAVNDLQQWYDNEKKNLSPDNVWLKALTLEGQDDNKTIKERSELINSIQTGLRLDPIVLSTLLYSSPDNPGYQQMRAANPYAAKWIEWTRKARENLNGSSEDWAAVLADMRNLQGSASGATPPGVPTTPSAKAASALTQMNDIQAVRRLAQGQVPEGVNPVDVLNGFLANSLRTGGNADMAKQVLPLISKAMQQVPKSQLPAVQERMKTLTDNFVYGFNGDADIAKATMPPKPAKGSQEDKLGVVTNFTDLTGSTPLGMSSSTTGTVGPGRVQLVARIPQQTNSVLSAVDAKLLLRAETTGEDIRELRRQFMEVFNQDGVPSENRSRALSNVSTGGAGSTGVSLGNPNLEGTNSNVISPALQARRDAVAGQEARTALTPSERLDYIAKLEKALKEEMSVETKAFLSRELKMMRGE